MKRLIGLVTVGAIAAGGVTAIPAVSATKSVRVVDDRFRPSTLTVRRGDTVNWRWAGDNPHNVTVVRGPVRFRSSPKESGSYRKKVPRRGTYRITCTIHGGMNMTLRVR